MTQREAWELCDDHKNGKHKMNVLIFNILSRYPFRLEFGSLSQVQVHPGTFLNSTRVMKRIFFQCIF